VSASADVSKLLKGLKTAHDKAIAAAERAVNRVAAQTIGDARSLTPVKTGALQASGVALPAETDGTKITATIGFNTNYAAAVHENLTAHHDVGQAKYLEAAMRRNAPKLAVEVAKQINEALK
jgi:hypothetical protein